MLGAMIGDTVGSVYEFNNHRSKEFELFSEDCFMTDDSIMTLAVMEIMERRIYKNRDLVIDTLKKWGRAYPLRGYGAKFYTWLNSDVKEAYGSYGNGAAMRISPVGYYAHDEGEVIEASRAITEVTHNHPEGLKGAEVTAMCVYYARIGKDKSFIRRYASKYYNLDFDYEDLKASYKFNETAQNTVPQAIYCFLISTSFEDAIRTAISIGGDSDTLAAITGGIAEAYYKHIPYEIIESLINYIPEDSNGCSPVEVIKEYLDDRTFALTNSEDIDDKSYILAELQGDEDGSAMSFQYAHSKDILIDYMLAKYLELEIPDETLKEINGLRNASIKEINELSQRIRVDNDIIVTFFLFANPTDALVAIGEDSSKCSDNFYKSVFNNVYMNFK